MSFLRFLLQDDHLSDAELLQEAEQCSEQYSEKEISDSQLVKDVEIMEQNSQWMNIPDSDVLCQAIEVEHSHDELDCAVCNSECVRAAEDLEAKFECHPVPLGHYQGPAVPVPTLKNSVVVLPRNSTTPDVANFDLGFQLDSDESDCEFKVPDVPPMKKTKQCEFKEPRSDAAMTKMGQKKFTEESYKKM